ncbi:MAG: TonB-dependent receptor [Ginsengibacter sp.]
MQRLFIADELIIYSSIYDSVMFLRQKLYGKKRFRSRSVFPVMLLFFFPCSILAQATDSNKIVLKKITVTVQKKANSFKNTIPAQTLNNQQLLQLNAYSIGDAAGYFSGVLIKDYGGIGGLKTISVRSLGATNTGIIYDGIPVSDIQSGQIDLGRFSTTFVQSISIKQANPTGWLLPARSFASSSVLAITTHTFNPINFSSRRWQAGIKAGSFALWQPFAGIYFPAGKNSGISVNAESVFSKGNYPFYIENGSLSSKTKRTNSEIQSLQGEINYAKQFRDSAALQIKLWGYASKRGLPGAVIFFNERSVQKLRNEDIFIQGSYRKEVTKTFGLLLSAKYSHTFTRYTDPDFLNNAGGLDNRYKQKEIYGSAVVSKKITPYLSASLASDASSSKLIANLPDFATPSRLSLWNSLSAEYSAGPWQLSGSVLHTHIADKKMSAIAATNKNKLTPTIAVSFKTDTASPYMFRFFYKDVFRMPTFNDLYYNFMGNNNLRPEYSRQYNLGIVYSKNFTQNFRQVNLGVDAYFNTVKDKIIAVPNKNLFVWTMLNVGKVHVKGIDVTTEASGKFTQVSAWFIRIAYTYQQAIDVTDPSSGYYKERIAYTPDNSGSAMVNFTYSNWSGGYNILFSGERYTPGGNDPFNQLPGWVTQDFFISRRFTNKYFVTAIKAELNNAANKYFDVVRYFPMPGRSFKIGLTIHNL